MKALDFLSAIEKEDVAFGTISFVTKALTHQRIALPEVFGYFGLDDLLCRNVWPGTLGDLSGLDRPVFIKPRKDYKSFTGFVVDVHDENSRTDFCAIAMKFPEDYPIWISDPVRFVSEVRYYVIDHEIAGYGRYDDGPDDTPLPDFETVRTAVERIRHHNIHAYALDFGVLDTGKTALVEVTDAWSSGYYKGTLKPEDYVRWLQSRYEQISQNSSSR